MEPDQIALGIVYSFSQVRRFRTRAPSCGRELACHTRTTVRRPKLIAPLDSAAVRIFSGIQPTGRKHLGNYIGAIRQYVDGQDRGESIYCVVDLHAHTVPQDPAELRERLYDTAAILLAAGLDPAAASSSASPTCTSTPSSPGCSARSRPGATSTACTSSRRSRRSSASSRPRRSSTTPCCMAADVLAYRANEVPVGDDQRQHVELMRDIAERFNARFGDVLAVPERRYPGGRRADHGPPGPDLARCRPPTAPSRARSTSSTSPTSSRRRSRRAVTDSGSEVRRGEGKEGIGEPDRDPRRRHAAARRRRSRASSPTPATATSSRRSRRRSSTTWRRCASATPSSAPTRPALEETLAAGAEKARAIASGTLADVREAMGVGAPG